MPTGRAYPPFHMLPSESGAFHERLQHCKDAKITEADLITYVETFLTAIRNTVDEFFPQLGYALVMYARQPFQTTIIRLGPNGIVVGHKASNEPRIEVKSLEDVKGDSASANILEIAERLEFEQCWFDAQFSDCSIESAHKRGVRGALSSVAHFFWLILPSNDVFEEICIKFLQAEGVEFEPRSDIESKANFVQSVGQVVLKEPAGFRRVEQWGFNFTHYPTNRLSASRLREIEETLSSEPTPEVLCLITSDDLTSVSRYVATESPRIRIWDRVILESLVNRHLEILRQHFEAYPKAIEELSRRLTAKEQAVPSRFKEFATRLSNCPTGHEHFAEYETIGRDILHYLFHEQLCEPKQQSKTSDEKHRRDVLFQNKRSSDFFERIFWKFDADFLIVDFKNSGAEIEPSYIDNVSKYSNEALGRFVLLVSRQPAKSSVEANQIRVYRDRKILVLCVTDSDLLEMIERKDDGNNPEDILADKLDELLRRF